jgi:glycosyltransferase involved in cell wall biosynthesis
MSPPSLRIMMTADAVGGVWVYATTLARALCQRGHRVSLVTLGPAPRADQIAELRDVGGLDVIATDLDLEWIDPQGDDLLRARARLEWLGRKIAPDLVHLNGYREATAAWAVPVLVVAHSCVSSWWRACRGDDPAEARWLTYGANVRAGLAVADRWVAPSAAYRDQVDALHTPTTAGDVIWNALPASRDTTPKRPVVLAAGRLWDEAKNVAALAAVASRLPWQVRIAGPLARGEAKYGEGIPSSDVTWLGELTRRELIAEMRRAAIFAAPAIYEPFGLTVLEAAIAGCALVLADIPSFRELWDGAALFVDPRDEVALEATLARVISDAPLRHALQRRAVSHAERYSIDAMCTAYCSVYEEMTGIGRCVESLSRQNVVEVRP